MGLGHHSSPALGAFGIEMEELRRLLMVFTGAAGVACASVTSGWGRG